MDTIARMIAPKLSTRSASRSWSRTAPALGRRRRRGAGQCAGHGYVLMLAESGTLRAAGGESRRSPSIRCGSSRRSGGICMLPMAFVVNPEFPAQSTQELIAALKANPASTATLRPASARCSTSRSSSSSARRASRRARALQGRDGDDARHHERAGADRRDQRAAALGPTARRQDPHARGDQPAAPADAPEWPALAETLPGFSAAPNVFLVAPPGTPAAVIQKLSSAEAAVASKDVEESSPSRAPRRCRSRRRSSARRSRDEVKRWAAVVKDAGIKVE